MAKGAMVIDARKSQILERLGPHRVEQLALGGRGIELAAGDAIEQILKLLV